MYRTALVGLLAVGIVACATATTDAAIGKLQSFNITISQAGNPSSPIVNNVPVTISGTDPLTGGTDYYTLRSGWNGNGDANTVGDITVQVGMSDYNADTGNIHFWIQSYGKLFTINNNAGGVTVDITNLTFATPGQVEMLCYEGQPNGPGDNMAAAYMSDYGPGKSYYYKLPGGKDFGGGLGWQVTHAAMLDSDPNYAFTGTQSSNPSATWDVMTAPPTAAGGYDVLYVAGSGSGENGDVFEMTVAASYSWVPEPATLGMCLLGGLFCFRRRLS